MDENLPDPGLPEIDGHVFDELARLAEEKTRHQRRQEGERMVLEADGTLGGLGPPPGALRDLVERLAALEDLQTERGLEEVRARILERVVDGNARLTVKKVTWPMIKDARKRR
jgi:hypothetical protein